MGRNGFFCSTASGLHYSGADSVSLMSPEIVMKGFLNISLRFLSEKNGAVRSKIVKYWTKTEIEIRVDVTVTGECQLVLFAFLVSSQIKACRCVDQLWRQRVYYGDFVIIIAVYAVVKQ